MNHKNISIECQIFERANTECNPVKVEICRLKERVRSGVCGLKKSEGGEEGRDLWTKKEMKEKEGGRTCGGGRRDGVCNGLKRDGSRRREWKR